MIDSLEQEKRIPASADYWKVVGIFFVYCAALTLLTTDSWMFGIGEDQPAWFQVAVVVVALVMPFFVLIWGAMFASRQIRQRTGYPSSPDGVILMLIATGTSGFLLSLPFGIDATAFYLVGLPFVVWVYLAILQRRFGRVSSPADPA